VLNPARARNSISIDLFHSSILMFSLPCSPNPTLFMLLLTALLLRNIIKLIRSPCSYSRSYSVIPFPPTSRAHLASISLSFSRLAAQSTRLRLKQLKKPEGGARSLRSRCSLFLLLFSVVNSLLVVPLL
jgi:hypothetical protein